MLRALIFVMGIHNQGILIEYRLVSEGGFDSFRYFIGTA